MYKLIGMLSSLEIAEMCARSGANCGSLFLDLRFRELVKTLLADHPAHLDGAFLVLFARRMPASVLCVKVGFDRGIPDIGSCFIGLFHAQLLGDHEDGLPGRGR